MYINIGIYDYNIPNSTYGSDYTHTLLSPNLREYYKCSASNH